MKTLIHFHLIVITSVLLSVDSCKSKKETTSTSSTNTTEQQTTTTTTTQSVTPQPINTSTAPKDDNVRFVVSFYSIGEGIDGKVNDAFVKFLNSYSKKIAYEPKHWGREGEIDYCLSLSELNSAEQIEFVNQAKAILVKSKLVHQKENAKCDHINWPDPVALTSGAGADSYRLVVSFYSTASGIDLKVNAAFEKFLISYPKKIAYEPTHWGREGEIDYCLKLSELSSAEQEDFVKKAKEVLVKSSLVHVNENSKCVHKH